MLPLRNKIPARRPVPTRNPKDNWREHKDDLRTDFNHCCGYCDAYDGYRDTYYEVDHFVPKSFFTTIGLAQYSNLVYACRFCNNNKRAKWPSQSETIHNDGKIGFIDPCSSELDKHLYRLPDGSIMWKTQLGKWMFTEAFKFDERQKAIKILWNLNRLRTTIIKLQEKALRFPRDTKIHKEIMAKAKEYALEYFSFHNDLIEYNN